MGKAGFGILWALATGAVVFLVGLPISLQAQLIAGSLILAGMIVLKLIRPEGVWRLISLSFGTAIVLRYVYWRTTSTLPPVNQLENFIPAILLYLAELYNVFMLFLSLFVVARPLPSRAPPPPSSLPANRRHLHPLLQRGRPAARHDARRRQGDRLPRRPLHRLASR